MEFNKIDKKMIDTELIQEINEKSPISSPAFKGTPTAPTPPTNDSSTQIATTAFVNDALKTVVPSNLQEHLDNPDLHVTASERLSWAAKETTSGAQLKVNNHAATIASTSTAGHVKPDGKSITIDSNGIISAKKDGLALEVLDATPTNLEGKGVILKKLGSGNSNAPDKPTIQDVYDNLASIAYIGNEDLATAIANTPNGGRLLLKNAGVYTISSSVTITKDIVIDGNNATISGNGKLQFAANVEIYNTKFERVAIALISGAKKVKIANNKFKNTYDNAIESFLNLDSLTVIDNEIDTTIVSTGTSKNFNNSGSFIYLNSGTVNYLRIQRNRSLNVGGGTNIFLSGRYPDLDISDNVLDTMAQRGIGFWETIYANGTISRNRISKCGVLKIAGADAGIGCNGIYSNGLTTDVEILDNHVEYVYENGIEGNYKSIKRNTIKGTGVDLINYPTPSYEGIFYDSGNTVIEDNTLINCMGHGIYNYTSSNNIYNVSIKRNRVVNDIYHVASAICFRSPSNQLFNNINIEDNYIDNFSTVIELPNQKQYSNIKIGKQTAINFTNMFSGFMGVGIDFKELGGNNQINLIKNGNFNSWDSTTGRFTDWGLNNATLTLVTDTIKNSAKVTATDQFNGRIMQTVAGLAYPSKIDNRYTQLVIRVRGNNDLLIRLYKMDANGTQSAGSAPMGLTVTGLSETTYKTYKIKVDYQPSFRLELCNNGIAGNWIEVSEVYAYLVDLTN